MGSVKGWDCSIWKGLTNLAEPKLPLPGGRLGAGRARRATQWAKLNLGGRGPGAAGAEPLRSGRFN